MWLGRHAQKKKKYAHRQADGIIFFFFLARSGPPTRQGGRGGGGSARLSGVGWLAVSRLGGVGGWLVVARPPPRPP